MTQHQKCFFRWPVAIGISSVLLLSGCGSPAERAQGYYERGMALIEKKDDIKARHELLNAVKFKADKVEAWRALAGVDERTGAVQAFYQDVKRIVELDPSDLDARVKLARLMVGGGAADAALKVLDVGNEGDKPNAALHALRSIILLKSQDSAGAVREAQRAIEIDPGNIDAAILLAAKKLSDGDAEGALKLVSSLTVEPRDESRIALQKMQIYAKMGNLPEVENELRKVISLNPKNAAYQGQLIQLLLSQRRFDEVEKEYRARVAADPTDSKTGLDLIKFLRVAKGVAVARTELETRIKSGGDVFDYQLALAELDLAQNKVSEAAQTLQTLSNTAATPEKKIVAQVKLAEMYVAKANIAAAEPVISEILGKDHRNASALKLRAAINIDKKQFDGAISDLREALNDQPKSPELLVLLALAYDRSGKRELADRQYADALKSSGLNPNVVLRYVSFLQSTGDASRAEDVVTEASNRYPDNVQLLASLGQIQLSRRNWTAAIATAEKIGRLGDGRATADQIRASALAGQNKIDESIAALEDARAAAPDAVQPVVSLASAYVRQGRADKATAMLQEVAKRFPGNAQILVLVGQAQLAEKKESEALQSFKEAVAQQPKNSVGYGALADLYIKQKNLDAAEQVLRTGLKESPADPNFRLSLAGLEILKGNPNVAIEQYDNFLKDQPNSLVAINNLVSLLLDYRSDKESLDRAFSLAEALKSSNVPQFQDTLGWVQFKQRDYKNSIATLEGVAAKLPNLAAVHYHLGMSYAAGGQPEKAAEQLKKALDLEPEGTALKESIRAAIK